MRELVIIGARAMARETCAYAIEAGMHVKGFLDSDAHALDDYPGYPPIMGSVASYEPCPEDFFVCALGDPTWKMKYVHLIHGKGGHFTTVIHPTAYIGKNVKIGIDCIICPNCTITNDTVIGDHVIVNIHASLNHDGRYGDYTTISPGCNIAGRCTIGNGVFMGVGSVLIPDITLGDGVYVAAGACVVHSVDAGRVMGVPARPK